MMQFDLAKGGKAAVEIIDVQKHMGFSQTEAYKFVKSNDCGAVVVFSGNVRQSDHSNTVQSITYQVHPSLAIPAFQKICEELTADLYCNIYISHAAGEVLSGESSIVVAVATGHRLQAFELCAELMNNIKKRVPIWKQENYSDGSASWLDGEIVQS